MAEAVRKSTRNKVFPKRYIGWYGLRMLTASRDRNAGLQPAGPLSTAESANEKLDHHLPVVDVVMQTTDPVSTVEAADPVIIAEPTSEKSFRDVDLPVVDVSSISTTENDMWLKDNVQSVLEPGYPVNIKASTSIYDSLFEPDHNVTTVQSAVPTYCNLSSLYGETYAMLYDNSDYRYLSVTNFPADNLSSHTVSADINSTEMYSDTVITMQNCSLDIATPSSSAVSTQCDSKSMSRKRKCNPLSWRGKAAKAARAGGLAYVSRSGKKVEAKVPIMSNILCREKCRLKCSERFTVNMREDVLQRYHGMDTDSKNNYIFQCITSYEPKVLHCHAKSHRKKSFRYSIMIAAEREYVCKEAFVQLHRITSSKVDHLLKQIIAGKP